jgi:alkanesulfonate monooxygenase SsuD/methylene tetrahydromethanopterin reductase-like flavin-dependent oxidoreductase (luciferase family)
MPSRPCGIGVVALKTIKLGTGVLLVQQRDAIQTAKLVASMDQVSRGRFRFGVGGGWNQDEMKTTAPSRQPASSGCASPIEAMKEIWTDRQAQTGAEATPADPCRRRLSV